LRGPRPASNPSAAASATSSQSSQVSSLSGVVEARKDQRAELVSVRVIVQKLGGRVHEPAWRSSRVPKLSDVSTTNKKSVVIVGRGAPPQEYASLASPA
jgi:hypothetical protein